MPFGARGSSSAASSKSEKNIATRVGIGALSHLGRDLRHGLRQFRRSPGFSALAVLCLGLAIGVNTSIFGVLNSVLLRPMPVQQPERLIVVSRGDTASFSYPTYREFRDRNRTLSGLAASMPSESDLDIDGNSTFVAAEAVSGNYSTVIGVRTALGRWFSSDAEPAAVISYAVWQRQFNLDPNVLGRTIRSESQSGLDRGCRAARVQRDLLAASNGHLGTDRNAAITRRAAGRQDSSNTDALRTVG